MVIESRYHALYSVSDKWVENQIKLACVTGYVPLAFGGRLRTPVLSQVIYGDKMPYKASEEARSAGNALGQSYGLLNTRSTNAFMEKVWKSKYRLLIKPSSQIHDAAYFIIDNTVGCLKYVNDNLVKEMQWQHLPELKHDVVKLGGELDVFPNWAKPITIPNNSTKRKIVNLCKGK